MTSLQSLSIPHQMDVSVKNMRQFYKALKKIPAGTRITSITAVVQYEVKPDPLELVKQGWYVRGPYKVAHTNWRWIEIYKGKDRIDYAVGKAVSSEVADYLVKNHKFQFIVKPKPLKQRVDVEALLAQGYYYRAVEEYIKPSGYKYRSLVLVHPTTKARKQVRIGDGPKTLGLKEEELADIIKRAEANRKHKRWSKTAQKEALTVKVNATWQGEISTFSKTCTLAEWRVLAKQKFDITTEKGFFLDAAVKKFKEMSE